MTVRVGVVGVGMIGQDHICRLTEVLAGSHVVAVTDVDAERAASVANGLAVPAWVHATGQDLIRDEDVPPWCPTRQSRPCTAGRGPRSTLWTGPACTPRSSERP